MIPTLSQVCSLPAPLEVDLVEYAAGACRSVELWLGKVETYLTTHTVADVRRVLDDQQITAVAASYQGGLLLSQGDARRLHWEHFARRLALCRELSVPTLVVAADVVGPLVQTDLDRVQASLVEAARFAERAGVRIALEFQASATFANNLQTAVALVAEVGSPQLGICLDAFHFACGPSKTEDLAYLTRANLFHVQLSDLAGVARELATDGDRILPGDGDLGLENLVAALQAIGYTGPVSVEVMNPELWAVPARQFGEIAITALRKLLGQAER